MLTMNYAYDGFGNLTLKGATNGQYSTNLIVEGKTNRVVSAGGVSLGYTANGSAQPAGVTPDTFTYDNLNRLIHTNNQGSQYGFGYMPGTNTRVLHGYPSVGITNTRLDFYGPDGKLLTPYQVIPGSPPQEDARYLYLDGKPISWTEDRVGSGGNYLPYGDYSSSALASGPYATYFGDAGTGSGGLFANQRYYNSNWGRFLTVDPLGSSAEAAMPQSWNRYAYAGGDPVNQNDPSGLDPNCHQVAQGQNGGEQVCEGPSDPSLIMTVYVTAKADPDPMYNLGQVMDILDNLMSAAFMVSSPGFDPSSSSPSRDGGGQGVSTSAPNSALKQKLCSALPTGRTTGVSGGMGGFGSVGGGGEIVINYQSGQVSAFSFGGVQVGWNGGASGSAYTGFVYGLNASNSNYSGGFTGVNGGAGFGGFAARSSGGLTGGAGGLLPTNGVTAAGVSFGAGLLSGATGGVTATNYSDPFQFGSGFSALIRSFSPIDSLMYLAQQGCK